MWFCKTVIQLWSEEKRRTKRRFMIICTLKKYIYIFLILLVDMLKNMHNVIWMLDCLDIWTYIHYLFSNDMKGEKKFFWLLQIFYAADKKFFWFVGQSLSVFYFAVSSAIGPL